MSLSSPRSGYLWHYTYLEYHRRGILVAFLWGCPSCVQSTSGFRRNQHQWNNVLGKLHTAKGRGEDTAVDMAAVQFDLRR